MKSINRRVKKEDLRWSTTFFSRLRVLFFWAPLLSRSTERHSLFPSLLRHNVMFCGLAYLDSYQPKSPTNFTQQQQEGPSEASKSANLSQNFAVTSQNHQIVALATAQAHQQGSEGHSLNQNHHLMAPSSHQPIPIGMSLNPSNPNPSSFLQQNFQQASNSQGPSPSSEDAKFVYCFLFKYF